VCLNVGAGAQSGTADFFIMSNRALNTFSHDEAKRYQSYGQSIEKVVQVPILTLMEALQKHSSRRPNIVSLDVEGMDLKILQSFDFSACRPEVFCVETLTYVEDKSERKLTEIIELMHDKGYFTYADTWINTIFVDRKAWERR
jgi:FkbM family methyltransferase